MVSATKWNSEAGACTLVSNMPKEIPVRKPSHQNLFAYLWCKGNAPRSPDYYCRSAKN